MKKTQSKITIVEADITTLETGAIVNVANESLSAGGDVNGAVHKAAGPGLLLECSALGGCRTGEAKITGGYDLPAGYVIHTVGPIWRGGNANESTLLAGCYRYCLELAISKAIPSLAFPAISCGACGYPPEQAAKIALATVTGFLRHFDLFDEIVFCCFDFKMKKLYEQIKVGRFDFSA